MNRNMLIGGVVVIVVVIVLLVVFVFGGGDDEDTDGGDEGSALTSESMTSAFQALLDGDATAAKDLACEDDQATLDTLGETIKTARDAAPEDAEFTVSCDVGDDTASCDLTLAGQTQSQEFNIVDGQICGVVTP